MPVRFFFIALTILVLFSCRKDEFIYREYIEVVIDGDTENSILVESPEVIIKQNLLTITHQGEDVMVINFGEEGLHIGENHPVFVQLPFGGCDDTKNNPCAGNMKVILTDLAKIDEFFTGTLEGKIQKGDEINEIKLNFSVILDDDLQLISGRLWFDNNANNLFDFYENGIMGVEVSLSYDGKLKEKKMTGRFNSSIDGYYEFFASTKYLNDIKIHLPEIGLIFVEKNYGNDPLKNSVFDQNGEVVGLKVNKGDQLIINAGVKRK